MVEDVWLIPTVEFERLPQLCKERSGLTNFTQLLQEITQRAFSLCMGFIHAISGKPPANHSGSGEFLFDARARVCPPLSAATIDLIAWGSSRVY